MKNFINTPPRITMALTFGLILTHVGLWFGRIYLPGFLGELCGKIQGLSMTPFCMEISLTLFGFMTVLGINNYRRNRAEDEFVMLEIPDALRDSLHSTHRKQKEALMSEPTQSKS